MERTIAFPFNLNKNNASNFVEEMRKLEDFEFYFSKDESGISFNAKSLLGMLSSNITKGENIRIVAFAENENDAFSALWSVLNEFIEKENEVC